MNAKTLFVTFTGLLVFFLCSTAQDAIRIATYNIMFLHEHIHATRKANLQDVIRELDADVIGLQEIEDRNALHEVFDPNDWTIVIDDDSGNDQDLALVVRNASGLTLLGFAGDLDADDDNFLFPQSSENSAFPVRRDALFAELRLPNSQDTFFVIVQHTKARAGGRQATTRRRVDNSRKMLTKLEQDFDGLNYVMVGDFNDSPDDSALNILEEGDPNATTVMENNQGSFLINLVEPLWAFGQCTWGLKSNRITNSGTTVNLVDSHARINNFNERNSNGGFHRRNLLDHILIPHSMSQFLVPNSATIFDHPSGVRGNDTTRASDHLPVYADFVFVSQSRSVEIVAVLPNPIGDDTGNETVTLENTTASSISLNGWELEDRASNDFSLSGNIDANSTRTITIPGRSMPLNQSGDTIELIDGSGNVVDSVTYQGSQVSEGVTITF